MNTVSNDTLRALVVARAPAPSLFRRVVHRKLAALESGRIVLHEDEAVTELGVRDEGALAARVTVHRPRFHARLALGGTLGAAESYVDGDWDTDDLTALIRVVLRNRGVLGTLDSRLQRAGAVAARVYHALNRNTLTGSRRNIRAHYDLGNDFFERMLDRTMTYSCGWFSRPDATLEEASREKMRRIAGKLRSAPGARVLEIGSGWGALAMHLAREGARVTTTTLSREQASLARARVEDAGLSHRVSVIERDYRELSGRFDRIVSVEMIEAIGAEHYGTFFARCGALLAGGGPLVLQTITIEDQSFDAHRREVDFIKAHVFPGSCIPSVTALVNAATARSDLRLTHLEDMGLHYARTLASWRDNLAPHEAWVVARYGRAFWRLWMFYLSYCEAAFAERYLGVAQMVFEQPKRRAA